MSDIKIRIGMLGAVCGLCALETGVGSPAYENVIAASGCGVCAGFGFYLAYENVRTAQAKTKGPIKGRVHQAR